MIRIINRLVPAVQLSFSHGFLRERPGMRLHQVWEDIFLCQFPLEWLNPMEEEPARNHDPKSSTLNPQSARPLAAFFWSKGSFPRKCEQARVKEGLTNYFFNATKKVI
jgi:hypothetical protein